ncbi:UDP-glucose 4-epimerase GalE [Polymorphobacter glacialis]|uniref:UDP-glucose 4-epimerase n=1 Tax=Sandarakinorhabdus glacialis TaxID=1614636 RepID=A0A917E800_9SPHN|nr:UDP-glucose 4-epimerase GalE [Polymorphobacter glacialis]
MRETDLPPVLVTGGAGYIGSHAALALLDRGCKVVIIDDLSTGSELLIPKGAIFVRGRAGDRALVARVIASHGIEAIMHFAASISVGDSVTQPGDYYRNNFVETLALAETAISSGVSAMVFSSTAAVYAENDGAALEEKAPLQPINPYGWSKMMAEQMLRDLAAADGRLSLGILRYFNVAGADPKGRSGQNSRHAHHLIEIATQVVTGKRGSFTVYGDDYATHDGTGVRDYVHVSDIAEAHVLLLRACLEERGCSRLFNLGYGQGNSVIEVIDALERVSGGAVPRVMGPRRAGDPARLVANADAAKSLGWTPQYDDLETIVGHALAWERTRIAAMASANDQIKLFGADEQRLKLVVEDEAATILDEVSELTAMSSKRSALERQRGIDVASYKSMGRRTVNGGENP